MAILPGFRASQDAGAAGHQEHAVIARACGAGEGSCAASVPERRVGGDEDRARVAAFQATMDAYSVSGI